MCITMDNVDNYTDGLKPMWIDLFKKAIYTEYIQVLYRNYPQPIYILYTINNPHIHIVIHRNPYFICLKP